MPINTHTTRTPSISKPTPTAAAAAPASTSTLTPAELEQLDTSKWGHATPTAIAHAFHRVLFRGPQPQAPAPEEMAKGVEGVLATQQTDQQQQQPPGSAGSSVTTSGSSEIAVSGTWISALSTAPGCPKFASI